MTAPEVEVLLPVHNEVDAIEATLREIHATVSPLASMRFLLCEDGSTDGTPEVLRHLAAELPMRLLSGRERKGYSRAVRDGFRLAESPWLLFLDSDGQVDPAAFRVAWPRRDECDLVTGWRVRRADALHRRIMSGGFRIVYRALFDVSVRDPSCPFIMMRRDVARSLADDLGVLTQGFWWEFMARVHAGGYRVVEIPVRHRPRSGQTQVYRWHRIPGIAWSHLLGLITIRRQLRRPDSHRRT